MFIINRHKISEASARVYLGIEGGVTQKRIVKKIFVHLVPLVSLVRNLR